MIEQDGQKLGRLVDRQDILDCLTRYCRGVDRLDRDILLSAYHPDATDDHGMFVGSPRAFADWVLNIHATQHKSTYHVIANHSCEIDGDTAHAETYCVYYGNNLDGSIDVVGNRYIDRLERRDGEWRILNRICMAEWYGGLGEARDPVVRAAVAELLTNAPNRRDRSDASYTRPLRIVREARAREL